MKPISPATISRATTERFISPPRDQLDSLRAPLTAGEKLTFEMFDAKLPLEWEIYVQPHMNGLRPDFVLLNPKVGIAVFEVKDLDFEDSQHFFEAEPDGYPVLWAKDYEGRKYRERDPMEQVVKYRDEILDLYCPRTGGILRSVGFGSVVSAGVILTQVDTLLARKLFKPSLEYRGLVGRAEQYNTLVGSDVLVKRDIERILPVANWKTSKFMSDELYRDLRNWLIEPEYAATQREPLVLDQAQRVLVGGRTESGYRRIKGAAGSGKSTVLAARAVTLSADDKDVLVVTFNITLAHYLRDLAVRYPAPGRKINGRITWLNFHEWCKRVCSEAGMRREYGKLWAEHFGQADDFADEEDLNLNEPLGEDVPDLAATALQSRHATKYDAILVDEGQDFLPGWWNVLRKALKPGGEMLLCADETQDLYGHSARWTDQALRGCGFHGDWVHLNASGEFQGDSAQLATSYRLPPSLVPHVRRFVGWYLPGLANEPPAAQQPELDIDPASLRWVQVPPEKLNSASCEAVTAMPPLADPENLAFPDVVLLVQRNDWGLECVNLLEERGIHMGHTFAPSPAEMRKLKLGFWMGNLRVKATTIHSFQGWGAKALVIQVGHASPSLLYGALTRLKRQPEGSYLTVVCSVPALERYGRTWPDFEKP